MSNKKIGLLSLTALVLSSMIGSGIFSLPQNMAEVAGAQALVIGWIITGIGIIFLGLSFFFISRLRPELDGGIYTYAREGFGDLVGFLSAWGYWLCATIGSVGYLVVAFEGIGLFTDSPNRIIFAQGNIDFRLSRFFFSGLVSALADYTRSQRSSIFKSLSDFCQSFSVSVVYCISRLVFLTRNL